MTIFDRRRLMGALGGTIGMLGTTCAAHDIHSGGEASPTNPKLVYSFNPRGLERGNYCAGLSFSHSGRYLAVINSASTFSGPSLSVWDIIDRKLQFKTRDLTLINAAITTANVVWGPNDEWMVLDDLNSDGILRFLDPQTGKTIKEIPNLSARNLKFNRNLDKVLLLDIGNAHDFFTPSLTILNTESGSRTPISVVDCAHGRQAIPLSYSWTAEDDIVFITYGAPNTHDVCTPVEIEAARVADEDLFNNYYILRLDPEGKRPHEIRSFKGKMPWQSRSEVSFTVDKILLDGSDILDIKTLNLLSIPIVRSGQLLSMASAFSPDGRLIYLPAFDQNGRGKSAIVDTATGQQVGNFAGAREQGDVALSPDGCWMAFVSDFDIQIYRLS